MKTMTAAVIINSLGVNQFSDSISGMNATCDIFLITSRGCMSSCHVVLLSVTPAIVGRKRWWSSPVNGSLRELCLMEELQRATATCWQPPHTTDWNLDLTVPLLRHPLPPSPQCSLFPVPSCLTTPIFFLPCSAELSHLVSPLSLFFLAHFSLPE